MSVKYKNYWQKRHDWIYYRYMELMVRCIGPEAKSILDVGSGNSPYLEWFDWIPEKVSVDIQVPYESENVRAIYGNILDVELPQMFDIVTCLQVLEHVDDPKPFARRLLELGKELLVSVPYKWPEGRIKGHVQDPVDLDKIELWFGRKPNYHMVVREPFRGVFGRRMICVFDVEQPDRDYRKGETVWKNRRQLSPIK